MAEWFIKSNDLNDGGDKGPYRPNDLLQLVRSGEVVRETMIRKDDSAWFQAGDVGGLFEAAMRPTIDYFCPKCNTAIGEPPCMCPKCDANVTRAKQVITENSISDSANHSATGRSVQNWLKNKVGKKK